MTLSAIKSQIIQKVETINDVELLDDIKRLIEIQNDSPVIYHLSEEQKSAVAEAQGQIKRGEFLSDDIANKEVDEWLKK